MTYMDPMESGKGEKLVPNQNLRNAILAKWFFQLHTKKHKSRLLIQCTPEVSDRPGKGTVPRKLQHTPIEHTPGNPPFANYERNPFIASC